MRNKQQAETLPPELIPLKELSFIMMTPCASAFFQSQLLSDRPTLWYFTQVDGDSN